jgi:CheY-like chemotaxis protein
MFRILLVEDDEFTLSQMKALLHEALQEPDNQIHHQIDTAFDVQTARRLIESAVVTKRPYDAVVLDLILPSQSGAYAEFDESLCVTIRALMPAALVVHVTAYENDEQVKTHVQKNHYEVVDRSFVLSKSPNFMDVFLNTLKSFLFGQQLEGKINDVFPISRHIQRRPGGAASLTHELAALCRDIAKHWNDLDEHRRGRVRTIFYVDDTIEPVRVSLLNP